jgi:N-carbamoylputrescine amidase
MGDGTIRVALVQQHVEEEREADLRRGLAAAERAAAAGARLIAFPELAFTPFYPRERACGPPPLALAEEIPGPTTDAFVACARRLGVVVVLNLYERAGERAFDSSPVINADGELLGVTRMLHIAEMQGFHEQGYYAPGDRGVTVYATAVGRVGVAICYDRHYPEVMRGLGLQHADVVVVPQAGAVGEWPDGLFEAELRVAAFQNGYFTALVNRVGREETLEFAGESFVCDPAGRVIARAPRGEDHVLLVDLDLGEVARSHGRRLFLRDRRPEIVPALLGLGGKKRA